jgi:transcription-repair coupling factor (superfamily II helicase)
MNLQVLLDAYKNNPRLFSLTDRLTYSQSQSIYLRNLHGSAAAMVISSILEQPACGQLNHVVICEDSEAAAYLHNNLESITGALDIFYFPSSFKVRKNYRLLNSSHVMLRTEALMKWSATSEMGGVNKKVLVTYPEALIEKVVQPSAISGNLISIKTGDVLNVDGVIEKLVNYGFTRTDFVYEPGQIALRGGILDILFLRK